MIAKNLKMLKDMFNKTYGRLVREQLQNIAGINLKSPKQMAKYTGS